MRGCGCWWVRYVGAKFVVLRICLYCFSGAKPSTSDNSPGIIMNKLLPERIQTNGKEPSHPLPRSLPLPLSPCLSLRRCRPRYRYTPIPSNSTQTRSGVAIAIGGSGRLVMISRLFKFVCHSYGRARGASQVNLGLGA